MLLIRNVNDRDGDADDSTRFVARGLIGLQGFGVKSCRTFPVLESVNHALPRLPVRALGGLRFYGMRPNHLGGCQSAELSLNRAVLISRILPAKQVPGLRRGRPDHNQVNAAVHSATFLCCVAGDGPVLRITCNRSPGWIQFGLVDEEQ